MQSNLVLATATLLLANAAAASTYVVDDTPGPGVHFSDIAPAIAAAVRAT